MQQQKMTVSHWMDYNGFVMLSYKRNLREKFDKN